MLVDAPSVEENKTIFEFKIMTYTDHVKRVPFHYGMARPQVANGEDGLQIWTVAANILKKQSRTDYNR
jgi:hypothetical protein